MRSTFNILFYVNKSKEKNGVVPVMGRVTINGTQSQFSCKRLPPYAASGPIMQHKCKYICYFKNKILNLHTKCQLMTESYRDYFGQRGFLNK